MTRSLAVLLLAGCAADASDAAPSLTGTWVLEDGACALVVVLDDGAYANNYVCQELGGTSLLTERTEGRYETTSDGRLIACPEASSCPGGSGSCDESDYELQDGGETLRLSGPDGVLLLERFHDTGEPGDQTGAIVRFGCFVDELGAFEPGPVQPL